MNSARGLILSVCVVLSVSGWGAEGKLDLSKLNEYQKQYCDWTDQKFGPMLQAEDYSDLSDSAREELGRHWQKKLQESLGHTNTGGGYKQEDGQKWQAINALAGLRFKPAVPELLKVATENVAKDNRERWMAVRALGLLGEESVAPSLIPLIYHYNSNTRLWAQISLVLLTGQNFGYDWKAWCEWWNTQNAEPKCSTEPVKWILPEGAGPEWNDPEHQKEQDLKQLGTMQPEAAKPSDSKPEEKKSEGKP